LRGGLSLHGAVTWTAHAGGADESPELVELVEDEVEGGDLGHRVGDAGLAAGVRADPLVGGQQLLGLRMRVGAREDGRQLGVGRSAPARAGGRPPYAPT